LLPYSCQSLVDILCYRVQNSPHKVAYRFLSDGEIEEAHLTYQELDQQARVIAAQLQTSVAAGDRVLLIYPPHAVLSFIPALFGCFYAGVIAVPTYPPQKEQQWSSFQQRIDQCCIQIVLTTSSLRDKLQKRWKQRVEHGKTQHELTWIATDQSSDQSYSLLKAPDLNGDSIAYLQYTSGSTGIPKGVIVTHGNVLHNSKMTQLAFEHDDNMRGLSWLPFTHDMGLVGGIIHGLYVGGEVFFMTPLSFMQKPIRWLQAISRYRITASGGPNFAYDFLCQGVTSEQKKTLDLSSWSLAFCGAEPIRAKTLAQFSSQFSACGFHPNAFYPCYGMAEATLIISGGSKSHPPVIQHLDEQALAENRVETVTEARRGAVTLVGCGHGWLDTQILIVNPETLDPCSSDEVGEVWVQGSGLAQGYWNHGKETEKYFHAYLSGTGEGPFLRTGDLGFIQNGELFIAGRLKDAMIFWGRHIYPQQLEETLEKLHSEFLPRGSAAFSVNVDGAERLVIAQELDRRFSRNLTPQQVKAMVTRIRRTILIKHFIDVYAIVFLKPNGLPKTSSGKVQRHLCRKRFLTNTLPAIERWVCPVTEQFNFGKWSRLLFRLDRFNWLGKILQI